MKKAIGFVLLCTAFTAVAVNEPRIEFEGEPPTYEVTCPEGAADASVCKVGERTYAGWRTYKIECQQCHGGGAMGSTFAPNLMVRLNEAGVDYGRFLYVMDNGYRGPTGMMPSLAKNPRVQKNKEAIFAYLKARANGVIPIGRPPKPEG
jgi:mono/diheme cytochrome c family protein